VSRKKVIVIPFGKALASQGCHGSDADNLKLELRRGWVCAKEPLGKAFAYAKNNYDNND